MQNLLEVSTNAGWFRQFQSVYAIYPTKVWSFQTRIMIKPWKKPPKKNTLKSRLPKMQKLQSSKPYLSRGELGPFPDIHRSQAIPMPCPRLLTKRPGVHNASQVATCECVPYGPIEWKNVKDVFRSQCTSDVSKYLIWIRTSVHV